MGIRDQRTKMKYDQWLVARWKPTSNGKQRDELMSERNLNSKNVNMQQVIEQQIEAVRKAWRLTPPEPYYRDPQWLRSAAGQAAKAGRIPKRAAGELVIYLLSHIGYCKAIDHPAIECVDGERHVIFEPYESTCSMDTARRIAAELSSKLPCRAWVSLRSWHYPGSTIRITLAPLPTVSTDANEDAGAIGTQRVAENASRRHQWLQAGSANVARLLGCSQLQWVLPRH